MESLLAKQPNRDMVTVTSDPLPLGALAARVVCPTAGAIATFIGTTRDNFDGKRVLQLEYEAYERMAEREMLAIIRSARARWDVRHVAISHRIGIVPIAESSVEIAISSAHRREALEAVHFAIDELKAQVPIWKKEVYDTGDPCWKENKESRATTIGQVQAAASAKRSRAAVAALSVVALGLVMASIKPRSSCR